MKSMFLILILDAGCWILIRMETIRHRLIKGCQVPKGVYDAVPLDFSDH